MSDIDLVIPLGRGSQFKNCELRYFLRSIEKFAHGIRRVVVVGVNPGWLSREVVYHRPPQFLNMSKDARIAHKFLWAFQHTDVSDEILMGNDDYVFLKPVDVRKIPDYQIGSLLESSQKNVRRPDQKPTPTKYQLAMRKTYKLLRDAGLPGYHYDAHIPMRLLRSKFVRLKSWWEQSARLPGGLVMKSVYGNHVRKGDPGPRTSDCKIGHYKNEQELLKKIKGRWVFSYADSALYAGMEQALFNMFPDKSIFEARV